MVAKIIDSTGCGSCRRMPSSCDFLNDDDVAAVDEDECLTVAHVKMPARTTPHNRVTLLSIFK